MVLGSEGQKAVLGDLLVFVLGRSNSSTVALHFLFFSFSFSVLVDLGFLSLSLSLSLLHPLLPFRSLSFFALFIRPPWRAVAAADQCISHPARAAMAASLSRRFLSHTLSATSRLRPHMAAASFSAEAVQPFNNPLTPSEAGGRGMQLIFLGCPGVGKGTYASRLSKYLGISHIAMGDLVRDELSHSTPMAQKLAGLVNEGKLVPDDIILELLSRRFKKAAESGESGFILDGFPRNPKQAVILDEVVDVDLVVNLQMREDALVMRCVGRRICSGCGGNYNIANIDVGGDDGGPRICMPPLLPPPSCAVKLKIRADDNEEVVMRRLRIYAEESKPVEDHYRNKGKLMDFDVIGGVAETWPLLLRALKLEDPETLKMAA